mgnify:FL=1
MVGATGSDQTVKARSTAQAFAFNASTNTLSASNILVGTTTSTGTASQSFQVTGGSYVSGNLGLGVTSPSFAADVSGDVRVQNSGKVRFGGTTGTTNFYIQYNSSTNSLDFISG